MIIEKVSTSFLRRFLSWIFRFWPDEKKKNLWYFDILHCIVYISTIIVSFFYSIYFSYHTRWFFVENHNMPNSIIVENSVTFFFILYEMCTQESSETKRKLDWNLNVNDVTAILRWNLDIAISNNRDRERESFKMYSVFSCEPMNDKMKKHVEKIHTHILCVCM